VAPAANAAEALDRLERFRFDLLIASSALPGMTWVELAERARRHVPRVLILTEPLESGVSAAHPAVTLLSRSAPEEELERYLAATSPAAPAS
jgi:CheY-like chemotaxis protein